MSKEQWRKTDICCPICCTRKGDKGEHRHFIDIGPTFWCPTCGHIVGTSLNVPTIEEAIEEVS